MADRPDYFAVPDPLDESKMSYWYRPKRGRDAGRLQPWPPRRSRWGYLLKKDVPVDEAADPVGYRAFAAAHFDKVRAARAAVTASIETDPVVAAARFAVFAIRCCCCGKTLTDERSKVYGVGPDCRQGAPAALVDMVAEAVRRAHAEHLATP